MFEKDAEEWVIDSVCKDCSRYEKCKSKEHCTCKECSKEKWQDGAEFGYNKANEWHYVKDGDLPKESKKYYVYSEEWGVEVRKFIADAGCFECRNNIVIAWKEIVLPKEIE